MSHGRRDLGPNGAHRDREQAGDRLVKARATITTPSDGTGGNCQILSWRFGGDGHACSTFLTVPSSGYRSLVIWENR